MAKSEFLKTTALAAALSLLPIIAAAELKPDRSSQLDDDVNCRLGFHFKCVIDRTREMAQRLPLESMGLTAAPRATVTAPLENKTLTTDDVYIAPPAVQTAALPPAGASQADAPIDALSKARLAVQSPGNWETTESTIKLVQNPQEKHSLQIQHVKNLAGAGAVYKARSYTANIMTDPDAISLATTHIVDAEISRGDLNMARTVAADIPDATVRMSALQEIEKARSTTTPVVQKTAAVASAFSSTTANTFNQKVKPAAQGTVRTVSTLPQKPIVQNTFGDIQAFLMPSENPDKQLYNASKASAARGDMTGALRQANQISNQSLRMKALNRISTNTPSSGR